MKRAWSACILVGVLLAVSALPLLAQRRGSSMPPSFAAITPGSIRAAGGPFGPMPPRQAGPTFGIGIRFGHFPGHHPGHGRRGHNGFAPFGGYYGGGYYGGGYYYDQSLAPEEPPEPVEPERPGLTIFEPNYRPAEQPPVTSQAVQPPPAPAQPAPVADERPGPSTILVFRDGHQQEVHNYAILGDKLIVLSDARAKRIALEELDLEATVKANDEQGVEFRLPGKG